MKNIYPEDEVPGPLFNAYPQVVSALKTFQTVTFSLRCFYLLCDCKAKFLSKGLNFSPKHLGHCFNSGITCSAQVCFHGHCLRAQATDGLETNHVLFPRHIVCVQAVAVR